MWIDIGVDSRKRPKNRAHWSIATRAAQFEPLRGDLVISRALMIKQACSQSRKRYAVSMSSAKSSRRASFLCPLYRKKWDSRGARTSAYGVDPLIAVAVDVTYTSDHPQTSKHEIGDIRLNGGPVISIGGRINPRVYQILLNAADEASLAYQIDPQASGTGTDTDVIQVARAGVATGLISIPCRYLHTGSEIVSLKDIDEVAELLSRFVLAIDAQTNVIP